MNVKIEHTNPVQAKLKVLVPASDVNERLNSYFGKLATQANIPGFRRGKAPTHVVKKFYAKESASDVSERIISEYVFHAVKEHNLHLVLPPVLLATDLPEENKDFHFEVELDLKPTLPKVDFSGLVLAEPKDESTVSDEEIDAQLKDLQEKDANFEDITDARPAHKDDCVVVQYSGSVDGTSPESMRSESQTVFMGKNQFLPEFEVAILGLQIGEEKTFDVHFPATYHAPELQGKTATFQLKLLGIKQKVLAPLDDEFAKTVEPDVQTLSELKEKIRAKMLEHKNRIRQETLRDKIGDLLVDRYPLEVSRRQVEAFAEKLAEQAHHMMHEMGVNHEETEDHMRSIFESSLKKAERDVRLTYILEAIDDEKKFEITAEDFQKRFEATALKTGLSIAQIKSYYTSKEEEGGASRLDRLRIDIRDEKSLDYALSQATIKIEGQ